MTTHPRAKNRSRRRQADPSRPPGRRGRRPAIEALEPYVLMTVNIFDVTTTADEGTGSLRTAMAAASTTAGPSEIDFQIRGIGPVRIMVGSDTDGDALPTITGTLFINGYSEGDFQRGQESGGGDTPYAGPPLVVIDGTEAPDKAGFDLGPGAAPNASSDGSKIQGLAIVNFANSSGGGDGVVIEPSSTGDVVSGNYIGIDYGDGASGIFSPIAGGNGTDGVLVESAGNTIGGTTAADRNVISNNASAGISIAAMADSAAPLNNVVEGNYIGTDPTGSTRQPNGAGVVIGAGLTTIGGLTAAARNVISGNNNDGIDLPLGFGGQVTSGTGIEGNYIGTTADGTTALGNGKFGIDDEGAAFTLIGGIATTAGVAPGNLISGNGTNINGSGGGNSGGSDILGGGIELLSSAPAIGLVTTGVVIQGNLIGTDRTGTAAIPNVEGVVINDSPNNTIGGTTPGTRNVISGNAYFDEVVGDGEVFDKADVGEVLSGGGGVFIIGPGALGDVVVGNYIGADITGDAPLGNGGDGIYIGDVETEGDQGVASLVTIGGTTPAAANVIVASQKDGVELTQGNATLPTQGDVVQGNLIGVFANFTGSNASKNGEAGVGAENATRASIIGNSIEDNGIEGLFLLRLTASSVVGNVIASNRIWGVLFAGTSQDNTVSGNTIANNGQSGIAFSSGYTTVDETGNHFSQNSIFANKGLGIAFDGDTNVPTPNSPGVHSSGPNLMQNDPVLLSSSIVNGDVIVHGTLGSSPDGTYTVEFFSNPAADPSGHGQGQTYLTSAPVKVSGGVGTFDVDVGRPTGAFLTATATDASNNTSEFSASLQAQLPTISPSMTVLTSAPNPSTFGHDVTFTVDVQPGVVVMPAGEERPATTQGGPIPTGTVTLLQGMQPLGTATLNAGGQAIIDLATLPVGTQSIEAVYSGDVNYEVSTSPIINQVVNPAPTTTTLTASLNPTVLGQPVSFTVTVAQGAGGQAAVGPTGTVTLLQGMQPLGSGFLLGGTAVIMLTTLPVGTHTIDAVYTGDANYNPSSSPILNQVVNQAPTVTTLTSAPNPSTFGQAVTFTVTVNPGPSPAVRLAKAAPGKGKAAQAVPGPTGTITLLEGMDPIGTGTLNAAGQATIRIVPPVAGTNSIVALYSGDGNYTFSESRAYQQVVNPAPSTTAVKASTGTATAGQPITLTATVARQHGVTPTGTVTFLNGKQRLGASALNASGQATLRVSSLGVGRHTITAVYGGDATFAASSSTVATVVINPASADGPRVTGLVRYGFHAQPTIFVLSFNGPLDPARAENVLNYSLVGPIGGLGRGGAPIAIGRAIYDAAARTVTLLPVLGLNVHYRYRLTINGTGPLGVAGPTGLLLDGAGTGQPGSDYVTTFGRSILVGPARAYPVPIQGAVEQAATRKPAAAAVDSLLNAGAFRLRVR